MSWGFSSGSFDVVFLCLCLPTLVSLLCRGKIPFHSASDLVLWRHTSGDPWWFSQTQGPTVFSLWIVTVIKGWKPLLLLMSGRLPAGKSFRSSGIQELSKTAFAYKSESAANFFSFGSWAYRFEQLDAEGEYSAKKCYNGSCNYATMFAIWTGFVPGTLKSRSL